MSFTTTTSRQSLTWTQWGLERGVFGPLQTILDILQRHYAYYDVSDVFLSTAKNFGPVEGEHWAHHLHVSQGKVPADLAGEFVRVGPNPKYVPRGGYHWFDGDGMIHGVRINKDGSVNYVNRFVQTATLKREEEEGGPARLRVGELRGKLGLAKQVLFLVKEWLGIPIPSSGRANTALVFHDHKLMALHEQDLPYEVRVLMDGKLETVGRLSYADKMDKMTAHPKVDPVSGELFFFGYQLQQAPYLNYAYLNKEGQIQRALSIDIPEPCMLHDFAITERYVILADLALVFRKEEIVKGSGFPFVFDPNHKTRIGVLDKYATTGDAIKWFSVEAGYFFHTANAWQDGDEVVFVACRAASFNLLFDNKNKFYLYEWRLNMKTGHSEEGPVLPQGALIHGDFPTLNSAHVGRKAQYTYMATASEHAGYLFDGIVKVDLLSKQVASRMHYGEGCYAGEAVFAAKANAVDEDDGYVMTYVWDGNKKQSQFWVLDAKDVTKIVAIVDVPYRIPYGFHGIFVSEEDLLSQRPPITTPTA